MEQLVVDSRQEVCFSKGRAEATRVLFKGRRYQDRCFLVLKRSLSIQEIQESVLDDWSTDAPAILATLKRFGKSRWGWERCSQRTVTEQPKGLTMDCVGSRTRA